MKKNLAVYIIAWIFLFLVLGIVPEVQGEPIFVWSKGYKADLGKRHIFPAIKYRQLHDIAVKDGLLEEEDFVEPRPIEYKDLRMVHSAAYVLRLKLLALTPLGMFNGENPVSRQILSAVKLACGGTYDACCIALQERIAMNLTGGFHHALPSHEEGFCYYNDVAIAIKKLQAEDKVRKVMVIDCDVHQGNGTAKVFQKDESVFTFDVYQQDNYPWPKVETDYGISFCSREAIDDEKYMKVLEVLPKLVEDFGPELIIYLAGADPYRQDMLGGFRLTKEGLKARDRYVIGLAREAKIPICILLAGGYAINTDDTIQIHLNTIRVIKEYLQDRDG